jgi:hypothetical protein
MSAYRMTFQHPDTGVPMTAQFVAGRLWLRDHLAVAKPAADADLESRLDFLDVIGRVQDWVSEHHGKRFRRLECAETYLQRLGVDERFDRED